MGDAPTIVLLVGLVFLIMATMAFIGDKYNNAIDTDNTIATAVNETGGFLNTTGYTLAKSSTAKNYASPAIVQIINATSGVVINSGNYTLVGSTLYNASAVNYPTVKVTYTYTYSAESSASNVTLDMNTELGNNTSIAGIVLTISLVGIVLTILIGVFMGIRRTRI
jgi:hypothetical protein